MLKSILPFCKSETTRITLMLKSILPFCTSETTRITLMLKTILSFCTAETTRITWMLKTILSFCTSKTTSCDFPFQQPRSLSSKSHDLIPHLLQLIGLLPHERIHLTLDLRLNF